MSDFTDFRCGLGWAEADQPFIHSESDFNFSGFSLYDFNRFQMLKFSFAQSFFSFFQTD